ncbi:phage gp6-like head-tail connector protein [bacterium]|nr:phage gp6-like head-tail connector protein [bacterium]
MPVENQTLAPFYSNGRNPYNYARFEQIARDIATPWLSLEEITQQLNLFDDESQDTYLSSIELATRMAIEDFLGMAIFPTQYRVYYANFGMYDTTLYLDLPETGIAYQGQSGVTINLVQYYGSSNTVAIPIASTNYSYDPTGSRVILNTALNELSQQVANPIVVTYTQNASPLSSYPVIKQAGLMLLTHIYNNRSNTTDKPLREIPYGVAALLRPYKPLVM